MNSVFSKLQATFRQPSSVLNTADFIMSPGKKKKSKRPVVMKKIFSRADLSYGTLNVKVTGYDMTLVEKYAQYIHNLCFHLRLRVADIYGLPTKTTEVMLMHDQSNKMAVDSILKTHERIIQLRDPTTREYPIFLDVILKNQPEGVQLSVQEHTEADFRLRFKARPELDELMAKMKRN